MVNGVAVSMVRALCAAVFAIALGGSALAEDPTGTGFFGNHSGGKRGLNHFMIFGGQLTENELGQIITGTRGANWTDTSFVGFTVGREVARWEGFAIELEVGAGVQFGEFRNQDNDAGHFWGAAYLRYDDFIWNKYVHTSIAGSIGMNYVTEETPFEIQETKDLDPERWLHYFSPEVTFAHPDYLNDEVVLRVHHRSSANGTFGCVGCGSNIVTVGYRKRF